MICRLAIAVAVILLTFTSSASAQSETRITGVVRDATGVGLAGATVTVTSRTTRDSKTATTGPDGSYSVAVAAGSLHSSRGVSKFSRRDADRRCHGWRAEAGRLHARNDTHRGDHRHGQQARADAARRAVLGRGAARRDTPRARRREPRERRRQRRRLHRAEPRSRPEPGRDARRLRRPDRARPAGREGAGRRLPRRVGHLALALHAGPRPLRHEPRRGAARTAGHAVRLRLALGHGALHHQPARTRA